MTRLHSFYFAPHQDDELLNTGAAICRDLDAGIRVHCVLCTDGSASGARKLIGNGGGCHLHQGTHPPEMNVSDFIAARDREFRASCAAMGLQPEDVRIPENRVKDGALTVPAAKTLILEAIAGTDPKLVTVNVLLPVTAFRQNPDHNALGEAAAALFREGRISSLRLFYETLHLLNGYLNRETLSFLRPQTEAQKKRLLEAAACYNRWDPDSGFFAVGYHSVFDEFAAFTADPFSLPV